MIWYSRTREENKNKTIQIDYREVQFMKKKIVTIIVAAMMMTSITACGTTNSASTDKSATDTEKVAVVDTDTEEIETEEPTELVEETEEIQATETAETENTEETQVASTDKKTQDATKNNASPKAIGNTGETKNNNKADNSSETKNISTTNNSTVGSGGTSNTTAQNTSTTSEHEHVWVEHLATGHYEEQVVTAAYDEPVYEEKVVCGCGKIFNTVTEWADHCCDDDCIYGYTVTKVQTGTTHHDAVTQSTWVEDSAGWYECSVCGEKSILASHNHN